MKDAISEGHPTDYLGSDNRGSSTIQGDSSVLVLPGIDEGQHAPYGIAVKVCDADYARRRFLSSVPVALAELASLLIYKTSRPRTPA